MRDLTVCLACGHDFVFPVEWEEAGPSLWQVLLRCGGCGVMELGRFNDATVNEFDTRLNVCLDEHEDMLAAADLLAAALAVDAILPEDF